MARASGARDLSWVTEATSNAHSFKPRHPSGASSLAQQADALGVVDESPETNNVTYVAIQVTIVP